MKATGELLVRIIKCYFSGEPLEEGANYAAAFQLAKMHSMGNLFYEAVKSSPAVPTQVKEEAKKHFYSNLAQQTAQEYYASELFAGLEEKGIWYVPLKGYILRRMYPALEHRTSCDVDVLYDKTRLDEVREILNGLGLQEGTEGDNHIDWTEGTVNIEMHHELSAQNDIYHEYFKHAFSRLKNTQGSRYDFTPEDFYIYFLAHSAKHFSHGGFGIRTVLDIWIYRQKTQLDEEYLQKELAKIQLTKFKPIIEALAEYWFGGREATPDLEIVSEYVLTSGTYGKKDNRMAIDHSGKGSKAARVKFVLRKIFPSYKYMKHMYPVLEKLPVLYPFAWVVRWFAVVFKRRKNVGKVIDDMKKLDDARVNKVERVIELTQIPLDKV
jgi:hypothetical protein